jgi:hypothetical protein
MIMQLKIMVGVSVHYSESIISERTAKNKWWIRENDNCGKVIHVDNVQRPEKVNDTCMKTITMVRGLTAIINRVYEGQQNQHACQQ